MKLQHCQHLLCSMVLTTPQVAGRVDRGPGPRKVEDYSRNIPTSPDLSHIYSNSILNRCEREIPCDPNDKGPHPNLAASWKKSYLFYSPDDGSKAF